MDAVVVLLIIFIVVRAFWLWYFKINAAIQLFELVAELEVEQERRRS